MGLSGSTLARPLDVFETAQDLPTWREITRRSAPGLDEFRGDVWHTPFSGRLFHKDFERISIGVVQIEGAKHVVERTERQVRAAVATEMIVLKQLTGTSRLRVARGQRVLRAGDMTIHTTDAPYSLEFEGGMSCLVLRFPPQMLGLSPKMVELVVADWNADNLSSGRLASRMVAATAENLDVFEGSAGSAVANNLVDLLKTTFIEHLEMTLGRTYASPFGRIIADLESRISDPSLTPSSIAESNFLSVRRLHALFRDQGTTVSRWIREKRLERCARDLADPTQRAHSVREIAERWGYENPTHFSTSFKEYLGLSPSEWRRRINREDSLEDGGDARTVAAG